jgi:hypothetical protein
MDSTPFERAMDETQKLRVEVERLRERIKELEAALAHIAFNDLYEGLWPEPIEAARHFMKVAKDALDRSLNSTASEPNET